jgi:hypothetical protein
MYGIIEYVPYLFIIIILIIIIVFSYLRIKYGFWYHQPVHHAFDFYYHFFPPGIIRHELPEKNKYTNFKEIHTFDFNKLKKLDITRFTNFIRINFHNKGDNKYIPKRENIVPYFTGFTQPCYFSFYKEDVLLHDIKNNDQINDNKIVSVITGRPLKVKINNNNPDSFFDVYYVDYLCVDMLYRKKGTAPQMIQTHEYNQRHLNKNIVVSLFKREGELTGIVPICVYNMYCFNSYLWGKPNVFIHSSYNLVECNKQNLHFLIDYMKTTTSLFDIEIIPEIANLLELIKTKNIFIYYLIQNGNIYAAYFFRKSCTIIEKEKEALTCFASINTCDSNDIFINSFKLAFWNIVKERKNFGFLVVENISNNDIIINNLILRNKPYIISPAAYFFYNFAYRTFPSNKVFIIN